MSKKAAGFTLVEMLIVIAIIAILAAISIVTYSGIISRANQTVVMNDLSNINKMMEFYKINHGSYPATHVETYAVSDAPITSRLISSDDDSVYLRMLYCSSGQSYALIVTMNQSPKRYFIVGSDGPVREIVNETMPGASYDACDKFMQPPQASFAEWVKGASGWALQLE